MRSTRAATRRLGRAQAVSRSTRELGRLDHRRDADGVPPLVAAVIPGALHAGVGTGVASFIGPQHTAVGVPSGCGRQCRALGTARLGDRSRRWVERSMERTEHVAPPLSTGHVGGSALPIGAPTPSWTAACRRVRWLDVPAPCPCCRVGVRRARNPPATEREGEGGNETGFPGRVVPPVRFSNRTFRCRTPAVDRVGPLSVCSTAAGQSDGELRGFLEVCLSWCRPTWALRSLNLGGAGRPTSPYVPPWDQQARQAESLDDVVDDTAPVPSSISVPPPPPPPPRVHRGAAAPRPRRPITSVDTAGTNPLGQEWHPPCLDRTGAQRATAPQGDAIGGHAGGRAISLGCRPGWRSCRCGVEDILIAVTPMQYLAY